MNILILGGSGYVGSELTPYLIKKKYNLTVIDRFFLIMKMFLKTQIKRQKL